MNGAKRLMLLVLVGLLLLGPVLESSTRAGSTHAVISTSPAIRSSSGASTPIKFEAALNQVGCDRSTVFAARIERQSFTRVCPNGWRPMDLNLVMCALKSLYSGDVHNKICPVGSSPVVVEPGTPSMKCNILLRKKWFCNAPARPQASIPGTTVVPAEARALGVAGTFCDGKLQSRRGRQLIAPFKLDGIAAGLVPEWDDPERCIPAEIISRLWATNKILDGIPGDRGTGSTCTARTGSQQFFPTFTTESWFFGSLEACQGISRREVRNCELTQDFTSVDELPQQIRAGEASAVIVGGCTFSPDGRLVIENIAPLWNSKSRVQALMYAPGIKKAQTSLIGLSRVLPANGCLTMRVQSDCASGADPMEVGANPWQSCLIKSATRRIGALYGRNKGLTGINNLEKIDQQQVTFDCVALAAHLGASKVKNLTAEQIFNQKSKPFEWETARQAKTWAEIAGILPIGTLLSTKLHLTVVVGHLEHQGVGFSPIVVEAENFLVGIVRAKIEDVKGLNGKTTRVVLPPQSGISRAKIDNCP